MTAPPLARSDAHEAPRHARPEAPPPRALPPRTPDDTITLRAARDADAAALARLAHLDAAPRVPAGQVLVALVAGVPVAALSVEHGDHVADPFHPVAAELLPLLELRAATLRAPLRDRRARPVNVWRATP